MPRRQKLKGENQKIEKYMLISSDTNSLDEN